jgi:putative ABC transport system substrate-binding protein
MRRRDFIAALGGAAAWPLAARAQQPDRVRHVGVLMGVSQSETISDGYAAIFREALGKLGWVEGKNLRIDFRLAVGDVERIDAAAAQLVGLAPEVIFVFTGEPTRAVYQQTRMIPIVFAGPSIETANIKNIARPEGNITGFPVLYPTIGGKAVGLLKEAVPTIRRIGAIMTAESLRRGNSYMASAEEAGTSSNLKVIAIPFRTGDELENTIAAFAKEPDGGIVFLANNFTADPNNREFMRRVAEQYRLPAFHWDKKYPRGGGLMSYGSDFSELFPRAASYVDRILRGAKVNELPVQYPTKFELVINVGAAKAINLTIPVSFLLRADEVIE